MCGGLRHPFAINTVHQKGREVAHEREKITTGEVLEISASLISFGRVNVPSLSSVGFPRDVSC